MMKKTILLLFLFLFKAYAGELEYDRLWESAFAAYFAKNRIPYLDQVRFYTYLYAAQEEAADAPLDLQNAVTTQLTLRFFPDFPVSQLFQKDLLAESILCKYYVRLKQEEENPHAFAPCFWFKKIPKPVQQIAKWIPWSDPLPEPPPPIPFNDTLAWERQIDQLETMRREMTEKQKELLYRWTGHHGPGANWRIVANRYMEEQCVPLNKIRLVRVVLMQALYDGFIAEMNAKYTYCIPRPYMMFPYFKPLIKKLKTPSYPSGHGIEGSVFATVMTYFFPENFTYWHHVDVDGSNTRMWGGVHFPEDIEQGRILGAKIASQILNTKKREDCCFMSEETSLAIY